MKKVILTTLTGITFATGLMVIPVTDNQVAAASINGDKDISIQAAASKYITKYVYNTGKKYPADYHVYSSGGYSGILDLEDAYIAGDGNWYGVYAGYVYQGGTPSTYEIHQ